MFGCLSNDKTVMYPMSMLEVFPKEYFRSYVYGSISRVCPDICSKEYIRVYVNEGYVQTSILRGMFKGV